MNDTKKQKKNSISSLSESLIELDINSDDIISNILGCIQKYMSFDAATFYLLNFDTKQLEKMKSVNRDVEILTELSVVSGSGLSGCSAESSLPILIADRTKKESYNPDTDYASFLSIPILRHDVLYGVINFGSFTKNNFVREHIQAIESVSSVISYLTNYYQLTKKYEYMKSAHRNSVNQLSDLKKQILDNSTVEKIANETAVVIHGINNSLSIIIGNLQCLLIGKNEFNQKSLSRLKRIETAAKKISESNDKILNLNTLVNDQADKNLLTIE